MELLARKYEFVWILLSILLMTPLTVMGEAEANPEAKPEARADPYHHYPYLGGYHHHHYPAYYHPHYPHYHPTVYKQYSYTQVCKLLIQRPHLLARLHGLMDYYQKHCYGTYSEHPSLGLGLHYGGWKK